MADGFIRFARGLFYFVVLRGKSQFEGNIPWGGGADGSGSHESMRQLVILHLQWRSREMGTVAQPQA